MRRTSLILLASLISVPTLAYELTGQDWTWQSNPVELDFLFNWDSWTVSGVDEDNATETYKASLLAWSEPASDVRVNANFGGITTDDALTLEELNIARYADYAYPGATVALASVWSYTTLPARTQDCDIEFFASNDLGAIYWGVDINGVATDEMDLQLVATHEVGHCLGMNHSGDVTAVMYESANAGSAPSKRDLTQDDLDGILAIYGTPPAIESSAWSLLLDSDGDNLIEAGEDVVFSGTITNTGDGQAFGLQATVIDWPAEISPVNNPYLLGDVNSGTTTSEITFQVDAGCTSISTECIGIDFEDDQGRSWSEPCAFNINLNCVNNPGTPSLDYISHSFTEDVGDGDNVIEPLETITHTVFIENSGDGIATSVSAEFSVGASNLLQISTSSPLSIGDLNPGDLQSYQFSFDVNTTCEGPTNEQVDVALTDGVTSAVWQHTIPVALECPAPQLQYVSNQQTETTGNGNGLYEQGEELTAKIFIQNGGDKSALNLEVISISSTDSDLSFSPTPPLLIGDVGAGNLSSFDTVISINPQCSASRTSNIDFKLGCDSSVGCDTAFSVPVTIDCYASTGLSLAYQSFTDTDGDQRIEQGEEITYTVEVLNSDLDDYTGVNAALSTTDSNILSLTPSVSLGDIPSALLGIFDFSFTVNAACVEQKTAEIEITLTDDSALQWDRVLYVELECSVLQGIIIQSITLDDDPAGGFASIGNADGVLQEGESGVAISVTVENTSTGQIDNVGGYLTTTDPNLVLDNTPMSWPSFQSGEAWPCDSCDQVEMLTDCSGTAATFSLQFYDEAFNLSHEEDFQIPLDCDEDDDGSPASADCDDSDPLTFPGATEICDGIDNDCNGLFDDGISSLDTWYPDLDADSYGDTSQGVTACIAPAGYIANGDDCDDTNPTINPDSLELCDGIDNDCNGLLDDNLSNITLYADTDQDGFGDPAVTILDCAPNDDYVLDNTDCDDSDYATAPNRTEICDSIDNDCDSDIDEDCEDDSDGDGWGESIDCDDTNANINPDADEVCDGLDNNCDAVIDNDAIDAVIYYADNDSDSFGDSLDTTLSCSQPNDFVGNSTDCDDTRAAVYPGAIELCNGLDNDCDGAIDNDCQTDADNDGYSELVDCDDDDSSVNPGATEICDGIDNDCDTHIDIDSSNMQIWYLDNDGDGFGTGATEALGCYPPTGYVDNNIDCDDSTSDRSPDNSELCDGIDNDCNLLIDDEAVNAPTWYQDEDGDGFGDPNSPIESCTIQTGLVSNDLDCDDSLATVYPSAPEIWYDNIDQNCDGIDDDQDQDGYPSAEDCDDTNKKIYPGSGHYDENCDLITTPGPSTEGATPKGGGGCATPIPFIPQLWWITVGLCLASRRRQPSA